MIVFALVGLGVSLLLVRQPGGLGRETLRERAVEAQRVAERAALQARALAAQVLEEETKRILR